MLFYAKFKVPWIVKWSYQIKDHTLIRNFAVKWWDNFDRDIIIKFVFDEFPEVKQVEDKPSSSILDLLKGKSTEELVEICRLAAIQCQSASASGKHSPASSEGSTTEAAKVSFQFPHSIPMPPNWYQDPLFQDSQDPYAGVGVEEVEALIEDNYLD